MREDSGDLWTYPADIRVITTNGDVTKAGELVMGRGTALQAKQRWPFLPRELAKLVERHGNIPHNIYTGDGNRLWTFPVKQHWSEDADLELIRVSAAKLAYMASLLQTVRDHQGKDPTVTIAMPRPGCGNGRLTWEAVKPILLQHLDDSFVVLTTQRELDT